MRISGRLARACFAVAVALSGGAAIAQPIVDQKHARTEAESKVDTNLLFASRALAQGHGPFSTSAAVPPPVQSFIDAHVAADGTVFVVIRGKVNNGLVTSLVALGATDVSEYPEYDTITARVPAARLVAIAQRADVRAIGPREEARLHRYIPTPEEKERLIAKLAQAAEKSGSVNSQGVSAHQTFRAVNTGITGAGVKVCVLSDGIDSIFARQASGDLPASLTILAGQAGRGDEGTAMLEIVNDLAPGASLGFATATAGSTAAFATNITNLRNIAGCDVIVDDVSYLNEGAFQDGPVAQAVNTVTASGAIYLSSAGNGGNLTHGTSGTYEGDFSASGAAVPAAITSMEGAPVVLHSFGANPYTTLTRATDIVSLKWSDPLGASTNDYDVVVMDSTGNSILGAGANAQNGGGDPVEFATCQGYPTCAAPFPVGARIYVVKYSGATRALRLDAHGGRLSNGTTGSTFGHNAQASALSVGAVDVTTASGGAFVGGGANPVESYSSDGPRRMFYDQAGNALTPGNVLFSTGGGTALPKVDIAAADCGWTATAGFLTFCGTSAAAPTAAAIAALVKSAKPSATRTQVTNALIASTLDIEAVGTDRDSGAGIVMAPAAVRAVLSPLTVTKTFTPPSIGPGGTSLLQIQVTNPNTIALQGVTALTNRTAGLVNASTPAAQATGTGCASTLTALPGTTSFDVAAATIPAGATCTYSVNVTASAAGTYDDIGSFTTPVGLSSSTATATLTVTAGPAIGGTNVALASAGAVASASSTWSANFPVSAVNNGDRTGAVYGAGGVWSDGTPSAGPDWVTIVFAGFKTIDRVIVFSPQDNYSSPVEPTDAMTFSNLGAVDFTVEGWSGSAWVPLGTVVNNNLVKRTVAFSAFTTDRIRVTVTRTLTTLTRLAEIEAWGVDASAPGPVMPTVSLVSSVNPSIAGQSVTFTASVVGAFPGTGTMTFNDGASAVCTGVALAASLATCTTSALAVGTHSITAVYSGDAIYLPATSSALGQTVNSAPLGGVPTNVALASAGAVATASSTWSANFPVSAVNNGDRTGAVYGAGGVWADGTASVFPDTVTIVFSGSKTIDRVVVFSPQDNYSAPVEPTDAMTFTSLGAIDFTVEGWTGSFWVSLGSVTNNNLVKRTVTFSAFTTDRIRVNVTRAATTLTRLAEIEAWGVNAGPPPAPVAPTVTVTSSVNPSVVGQSVTFTATVAGTAGTATGIVTFNDPGSLLCSGVTLSGGQATCTTSTLTLGTHSITALYSGDARYLAASSGALTQTVNVAPPASTNVALASAGAVATASSTWSANFPVSAVNNGDRTGAVYGAGGVWADGTASVFPDAVTITFFGSKTIDRVVVFSPQDNYSAPVEPTDAMTFTSLGAIDFTVEGWNGSSWVLLGSVTNNNLVKRTVTFAAFTTDRIRVNVSRAATTLTRLVEIEAWGFAAGPPPPPVNPTVTVTSSVNPSTVGQSITFTATVTGGAGTASGIVTFNDPGSVMCSGVTLSAGQATCTTSTLAPGTHSITAVYSGDARYNPATSATLTQTVNGLPTTVTIRSGLNPSFTGQKVFFTATVSGAAGAPTGTLTFNDGAAALCAAVPLSTGQASCSATGLAAGTHSITATYSGNSSYSPATSGALSQTVEAPSTAPLVPTGPTQFIAATNRMDMVHDGARNVLYITAGSSVLRYSLATRSFLSPYVLTGNLKGIDISGDGNLLAVANSAPGVHVIDLRTDAVTTIPFTAQYGESGAYSVAFGADGNILVSTSYNGSGWVPLRKVNPVTGAVSQFNFSVSQDSMLSASGDRQIIGWAESNASDGPVGLYRVGDGGAVHTNNYVNGTNTFNYEISANRDGTQLGVPTYGGLYTYDANLGRSGPVAFGAQPLGLAYHPTRDIAFIPLAGTTRVKAFNTATYQPIGEYEFGVSFPTSVGAGYLFGGRAKFSRDGRLLFVTVANGVRYLEFSSGPVTPVAPGITLASSLNPASGGQAVTFTATVSGTPAIPQGTVTFKDGSTTICASVPLASGTATCSNASLSAGTHSITAQYAGDSIYAAAASTTLSQTVNGAPPAGGTILVPLANRADMVHDAARNILYVTAGGLVQRYSLASRTFLSPYALGTNLKGIDLSADGNLLAVADTASRVHVVDLRTDTVTTIAIPPAFGESGAYSVAFGADGNILVSTSFSGSGWVPLRKLDPATGAITVVAASVTQDSMLSASGDRQTIAWAESNISSGPVGLYRVGDGGVVRTDSYTNGTNTFNYEIAANRDGTKFTVPVSGGIYVYDASLARFGPVAGSGAIAGAHHPSQDVAFFPWAGTTHVKSFDTTTWQQVGEYDFGTTFSGGAPFGQGRTKLSRDGQLLFVSVDGGVRYIALASGPVTPVAPNITLTSSLNPAAGGQAVTFTATVSASPLIPQGTVTFKDGATALCLSVPLTSGQAACANAALAAGTHSITAEYSGSPTFTPVTSTALAQTVNGSAPAGSAMLVPLANRADMVYEATRNILYVTSGGWVQRYSLASRTFLSPYVLGTNLKGIDISADGNLLAVADTASRVHVVDLRTDAVTTIPIPPASGEAGAFSVAFGADGNILVTTSFLGSGWVPLRKLNLATGAITVVAASVRQDTMLSASGDRQTIAWAESNMSTGPVGLYRVGDGGVLRAEGYTNGTGTFNYEIAANRDGTQLAVPTYGGIYLYNASLTKSGPVLSSSVAGVAYHPTQDLAFVPWSSTTRVKVFNTATWQQVDEYEFGASIDAGGAFGAGRTKLSRDGQKLFVSVNGGVRYLELPSGPVTPVAPGITLTSSLNPANGGQSVTFTAKVLGSPAIPQGAVTFKDGTTTICASVPLASGQALCANAALSAGTHSITAEYSGNANYTPVTSTALAQTVNGSAPAGSAMLVPLANRADMVHEATRNILYVTSGGWVQRYSLASRTFLSPYVLGTNLKGIDISADGNLLAVADTASRVHVVDLRTDAVTTIPIPPAFGEGGAYSVAFGADGNILVSTSFNGSGWVPLRKVNPTTGAVTVVAASVSQDSMLSASGDRQTIAWAESNSSDGPVGLYRVGDGGIVRTDGYTNGTNTFNYEIAANRDGTKFTVPTYVGIYVYNASLARSGPLVGSSALAGAFHPTQDLAFFPWLSTTRVKAFDATTWQQVDEYDFGTTFTGASAFGQGRTKFSRDGQILFISVDGGVRYLEFPSGPVTPVAPNITLTSSLNPAAGGQAVTFNATVTGSVRTPTGTVTFQDGTTTICASVPLISGQAACSSASLSGGSHTITAQYSGNANYTPVTSTALTQTVNGTTVAGTPALVPVANRVDMAHDTTRNILYVTAGGWVQRYSLASRTFLPPYVLGNSLKGLDISADGNFLAVADSASRVHIVDLRTDAVTTIPIPPASGEAGAFSVAFGADGNLLVSTSFLGSGWVPLRKVNPATGAVSVVVSSVRQDSMLSASGDRQTIAWTESNISDGPVGLYRVSDSAITRTQGYANGTNAFNYEIAANRDGSQFAVPTYAGIYVYNASLARSGPIAGGSASGGAYHPTQDLAYFPWNGTTRVKVFNTTAWQPVTEYDFGTSFNGGTAFGTGRTKVSRDGQTLFVAVDGGVRYVDFASARTTPSVALTSSLNPSTAGVGVTFTAAVTGNAGVASGTMTFNDGAIALCTGVALVGGQAACSTTALAAGTHSITAAYSGNSSYFAKTSSALAQVVNPAPVGPTNVALATAGAVASASSTWSANFPITAVNNGESAGTGYGAGGVWADGTASAFPDSVTIVFSGWKTLDRVIVFSPQDNYGAPLQPTDTMTFTNLGAVDFTVEGWNGSGWVLIGSVTGNNLVKRTVSFPPPGITTDRIRVNVTRTPTTLTRLTEIEAWGVVASGPPALATPTVNLASSLNPSTAGQSVTFTATVSGSAGAPTGTATFNDGATTLCTGVALFTGQATCTTAALTAGTHTITVTYGGNSLYTAASATLVQTVNAAPVDTGPSNVALASAGAVATASSTWSANFPVSAVNNGDRSGAGYAAGGVWTDGTASAFPDSVTIVFSGSKTIDRVIVFSPQDNYSAPVEPTDAMTFTNLGAIDFTVEGWNGSAWALLGSVTGNNLVKRTVTFTAFTTDRIRVNVSRTATTLTRLAEIEAWTASAVVPPLPPANLVLTSSLNPSSVGQTVTFATTVSGSAGAGTGTVTFSDGASVLCSAVALSAGQAACTTGALTQGAHSITVAYSGNSSYGPTISAALTQTVNAASALPMPTVQVSTSPNPSAAGQNVTFTATVSGSAGPATGTVAINDGTTRLCSDTLTAGQLTCTLALDLGTHTITAAYLGDSTYAAATSAPVTHTVNNSANVALASAGAIASASSTWNANFPVGAVNNGDRTGAGYGAGGVWTDGTASAFPDTVTIVFNGSKTINRVVVFSPQDNYSAPVEPSDTMTFTSLGAVDFTVEGWNGSSWAVLGTVTGNNLVKRTVAFPNFTTDRIRVNVSRTPTTLTRLVEIEAWGS